MTFGPELVEVTDGDYHPLDMIEEGVFICSITYPPRTAVVGTLTARCEPGPGGACVWSPTWDDQREIDLPEQGIVIRRMLPPVCCDKECGRRPVT